MNAMILDGEELQKFRNKMQATVEDLRKQLRETQRMMEEVAQGWKDEQFKKYNTEFSEDVERFEPLCQKIEVFDNEVLLKLQKNLEEYCDL